MRPISRNRGIARAATISIIAACALLAGFGTIIAVGQRQTRNRSTTNFTGRVETTAAFAQAYVTSLAGRETAAAVQSLSTRPITPGLLNAINTSFGFSAAVVLDARGRALALSPPDPTLLGHDLATTYAHLRAAERGHAAVSDVVPSAVERQPVVAVAVPFATPFGRRVYSGAFAVSATPLGQYLGHVVVSPHHNIYLIDATGAIIASSPSSDAGSLSQASPTLARAMRGVVSGSFVDRFGPSSFAVSSVSGTPWKLVLAEPNSVLYASSRGLGAIAPWIVFGAAALFTLLFVGVLLQVLIDRRSLAKLSALLADTAATDELTGLSNRRDLVARLEDIGRGARTEDRNTSVLMIDLDKFKAVNDTYGHDAGDRTLVAVAGALRAVFRDSDFYGRWGGDEFLAILPDTDALVARSIADRLGEEFARTHIAVGDTMIEIGACIGVASGSSDIDDLLRRADVALYRAKAAGGAVDVEEATVAP